MGTATILIPALLLVLLLGFQLHQSVKKNQKLEQELQEKTKQFGYVLTQDLLKGQKVESNMLQKVNIQGESYIQSVELKELVGKYAKCDLVKGTSLNSQCVRTEAEVTDDVRIQDFDFMEVNSMIQQGDYIDIRIVYPSGEDYIVANHKEVLDLRAEEAVENLADKSTKLFLQITEVEILRIASAYVDLIYYPGTKIYVVSYLDPFQEAGIVNYPVNPQVFELLGWNPNVVNYTACEQEQQKREILEEHLSAYVTQKATAFVQQSIAEEAFVSDTEAFFK